MLDWPAIVKCGDEDELLFVANRAEWVALQQSSVLQTGDVVIDSSGLGFAIDAKLRLPERVSKAFTHEQVIELVRQHAAVCGHCCVSKLGAQGIAEAVALVGNID